MTDPAETLRDPEFQALLRRRSRWRWGLSAGIVGAYLAYVVAGIYIPEVYALRLAGRSVPLGVLLGYLIIAAAIALSILYVRVVNRLTGDGGNRQEPGP